MTPTEMLEKVRYIMRALESCQKEKSFGEDFCYQEVYRGLCQAETYLKYLEEDKDEC